jgi:hypothetical protein
MTYKFLLINKDRGACSMSTAGKMLQTALEVGPNWTMDYMETSDLDIAALNAGKVIHCGVEQPEYDAYFFNYHISTMREISGVRSELISKNLPGKKFCFHFEGFPNNPYAGLEGVNLDDFAAYLWVDPTSNFHDKRFYSFPRPLETVTVSPYKEKEIPVIGTYGLAGHGRNLGALVQAVNAEFDRAIIRMNYAPGSYYGDVGGYAKWEVQSHCLPFAKPGIEIQLTEHYFSDHELLEWLAQNTLNVFFYARNTTGISSATDQAIMVGRPMLCSPDHAFRHIHQYIPPYPATSFREAIAIGEEKVKQMQNAWNFDSCKQRLSEIIFDNDGNLRF